MITTKLIAYNIIKMEGKGTGRSPEDIIYDDIDDYNKKTFGKVAEEELKNANK